MRWSRMAWAFEHVREPLRIAVVIDCSGSMADRKLDAAKVQLGATQNLRRNTRDLANRRPPDATVTTHRPHHEGTPSEDRR